MFISVFDFNPKEIVGIHYVRIEDLGFDASDIFIYI